MPLPAILGMLAALGVGGGLGALQGAGAKKQQETDLMRKILLDTVMKGTRIPEEAVGKYFSKDMGPSLHMLAESNRIRRQEDFNFVRSLNGDEGGPPPNGGPNLVQNTPQGPMVPGTPQQQQPGTPQMPWMPPMLLPPEQPATPTEAAPMDVGPRQAPAQTPIRARSSIGGKFGDFTFNTPAVSPEAAANANRAGFEFQQKRDFDQALSTASKRNMPYNQLVGELTQRGLMTASPQGKDALATYGENQHNQLVNDVLWKQITGGRRPYTPAEAEAAEVQAYGISGFKPPKAPDQQSVDQRYVQAVQSAMLANPGVPFSMVDTVVRGQIGGAPSQQAVAQVAEYAKATAQRQVQAQNPNLNPAAVQSDVNKQVGQLGVTEAERTRANAPVEMDQATKDVYTAQGLTPPLQSQMRGAPAAGPMPGAAIEQGKAAAAKTAGAQATATAAGGARGRQATAGEDLVPDTELLQKYIEPNGEPPQAGLTRAQLNEKVNKGEIGVLHTDPRTHRNIGTVSGIIKGYTSAYPVVAPLLDKWGGMEGILSRIGGRMAAAPSHVGRFGIEVPIPALTDEQVKKLGITKAQADALAAWHHYGNTALLTIRSMGEGERGNVGQKIVGQAADTFPTFLDNSRTSGQKLSLLVNRLANEYANSATFRGKAWAYGLDPKTMEYDIMAVPKGSKLPPNWKMVR